MAARKGMEPATPPRIDGRIFLILSALLIALAGAGTGGMLILKPATAHTARQADRAVTGVATYIPLPAMSVSFNDGMRQRDLQLRLVLEMDPGVQAKLVEPLIPRIADAVSVRMQEFEAAELRGSDGPLFIKDAVRYTAGKVLRPLPVRQVLIQDMLMR
ncbi:flagellar basal body-associated FliL family protein [Azospirillum thermophilum]|nr:flagellar basal body-associated FliL family protein [Azospirillum thermophilum]